VERDTSGVYEAFREAEKFGHCYSGDSRVQTSRGGATQCTTPGRVVIFAKETIYRFRLNKNGISGWIMPPLSPKISCMSMEGPFEIIEKSFMNRNSGARYQFSRIGIMYSARKDIIG